MQNAMKLSGSGIIYLVAGEASGDALGAGLMQELRVIYTSIQFAGIGGEAMQGLALQSLFPYQELSIMGFSEIIPHIPKLLQRLNETVKDIERKKPAMVITIDSPGFTFRLAKLLKKNPATRDIPRVHYVAPSVWAYKPKRAYKTAQLFNKLLTLLPFEPPYFEKEGLSTAFVGHPVLWQNMKGDSEAFRARHGIAPDTAILLLLPGSRGGEVKRHLPLFLEAARKALPNYTIIIMASPQVHDLIKNMSPGYTIITTEEKKDAFAAANFALSKSGTITLELAQAGVPMVVAHKVNAISAWLLRRMILIHYVSLVNIAVNKPVIPELLQENCTESSIIKALKKFESLEARNTQLMQCKDALESLRGGLTVPPSKQAAQVISTLVQGA